MTILMYVLIYLTGIYVGSVLFHTQYIYDKDPHGQSSISPCNWVTRTPHHLSCPCQNDPEEYTAMHGPCDILRNHRRADGDDIVWFVVLTLLWPIVLPAVLFLGSITGVTYGTFKLTGYVARYLPTTLGAKRLADYLVNSTSKKKD